MKKILLTFCFALFGIFTFAQSSYEKALNEKAQKIAMAKTATDYDKLFKEFSALKRSQDPYKWKAYYYASVTMYKKAELILSENSKTDIRNINSLAEKFVMGALENQPNDKESNDLLDLIKEQRKKFEVNGTVLANKK